jgi:hypothetical protein
VILSADSFGGLKNNLIQKHIMATVTLPKEKLELVYSQLNFLRNYVGLWSLEADEYVVSATPVVAVPVVATPVVATPAPVVAAPVVAAAAAAPVVEERLVVEPTVSSSPSSADAPSLFGSFTRSFRS